MLHIGIVACSTEGAALCYRTISLEGAQMLGPHDHPEVSLHSFSLAQYMKCIDAGDWAGVAELMLASAEKLAKAGADFLICPGQHDPSGVRSGGASLAAAVAAHCARSGERGAGSDSSSGWRCSARDI